jgi:ABC-2 type transport system ATP-binding protein
MSISPVINVSGLCYQYAKGARILQDVNLQVEKGSIYGFLGPNGSGKTTTLSLMLGLLKTQQGSIEIFGQLMKKNRNEILRKIGALVESPSLYGQLSAKENLEIYRPLYGVQKERIDEVLLLVGLQDTGTKPVRKFSLGMKQRLSIALALLPRPELLVLDEPTNGLDPSGIIELRELMRTLNRELGLTLLISSHILSEVEKMVTHLGIISRGKMLFQGTLQALQQLQQSGAELMLSTSDNSRAFSLLERYRPRYSGESIFLPFTSVQEVAAINRMLMHNSVDVYLLQHCRQDLEQIFIDLTTSPS